MERSRTPVAERPATRGDSETVATVGPAQKIRAVVAQPPGPLGFLGGWTAAWGAAAVAATCLASANVDLALGLGIAGGDGFWPTIWLGIVQAGAFFWGGYVAARMGRRLGIVHAGLAWLVAMIATGVDAIAATLRDTGTSVLAALRIPYWAETGLDSNIDAVLALGFFAVVSLVFALLGGAVGEGANRGQEAMARRHAER